MKLLLVLEHHFFEDKNHNVWCERVINYDFFRRYLQTFDEIFVCARLSHVDVHDIKWQKASGSGVRFIAINDFQGFKGAIANFYKVKKVIRKSISKVDICILRAPSPISILAYAEISKSKKIYALEMMMSAKGMFVENRFCDRVANCVTDIYIKQMCKKADGVAYVTENILQKKYPTFGIVETYSSINLDKNDFYKQCWNREVIPKEFIIISTGYMDNRRKGQDVSIKTTKILLDRGYKIKLVLIGDGKLKEYYVDLSKQLKIENNVEFTGLINNKKEVKNRLINAHLFLLPSKAEGLPRSILEGMAVGLPCVASDVDGIPELIGEDCLVNGYDAEDYADRIECLLKDWNKMITLGNENYEKALSYSREILDNRRKRFYDKLICMSK